MPLRDHFHSPVNDKHHWSEVHGGWPMEIVRTLFDILPQGYQAGPRVYLGSPSEVDVSVNEDDDPVPVPFANGAGGTALATSPSFTLEANLNDLDEYEVRIYDAVRERRLVAAIEIVSPSNKDRPDTRDQFTGKVAALLRQDVCVAIIDIVTERHANLYAELLTRLGRPDPQLGDTPPDVYATTLRARRRRRKPPLVDAWFFPLRLGQPLPTIPLWLSPDLHIELPLEPSYQETCRLLRIA